MHTEFRIQNTDLVEVFKSYIERRLRFALGRFGDRVGPITVRVSGGGNVESECRISTELRPFGRVAVEEKDSDLFVAVDRATGRIGRLFGRELERNREARLGRESIRIAA